MYIANSRSTTKKKKENTDRIRKERNWNRLKCSTEPQKATTRMNLENIVLSEISQTEKDKYCVSSPIRGI